MCHMDEKKNLLELKILYLGITFLFLWELVSLTLVPSRFTWGWWPETGGPDSASLVGMQFLGKIYWGQWQPWGQAGASLDTLTSLCVCLWACPWYWGEMQCHFGVNFLLRTPEGWGNRLTHSMALIFIVLPYIVTIFHFTYRSFNFDLLSCLIMGFSLNLVINSAL